MKRLLRVLPVLICLLLLCGCALDYSSMETEGPFSYACGKHKAFIYRYSWDGTEEGKTVEIPDSFGEYRVVAVGGFYGRGLPMPFSVDIGDWIGRQPGTVLDSSSPVFDVEADETVTLDFTFLIGPTVEDIRTSGEDCWYLEHDGTVTEFLVRTVIERKS